MHHDHTRRIKSNVAIARALLDEVERSLDAGVTAQLAEELQRVATELMSHHAVPISETRLKTA